MMSGISRNTKQEKAFREMLKQTFMDYKDLYEHNDYDETITHDLNLLEDVAIQVFGWTTKQIEINENRWRKEWKRENE